MTKFSFLVCIVWLGCHQAAQNDKGHQQSGKTIEIDDKVNVLYFLNTECPVCQKYGGSLKPVFKAFSGTCTFYYVFPGRQKEKDVQAFCDYDSIPETNVIHDVDYKNAKQFGAIVTPQVMIFSKGILVYSGKIDDRFETIASIKQNASINYIGNALNSLLKNEVVEIKKTNPVGCFIEPD